ncbi:hypothetical protein CEXT_565901 [Caerostris extrusa]|uniref:Peptidase M12A domain-containing protein n=1 Tax=Caerostris extrusa TaxID=172846 RepID=A0AAV4PGE1_CAEEX|nr:hypothetical protein CEXT_565901 [Caerostris extrusa]
MEAMEEFRSKTCIRFIPRLEEETPFIMIAPGTGCSATVGRKEKGKLFISDGCKSKGIIIHELMHVLGFFFTNTADRTGTNMSRSTGRTLKKVSKKRCKNCELKMRDASDISNLNHLPDFRFIMQPELAIQKLQEALRKSSAQRKHPVRLRLHHALRRKKLCQKQEHPHHHTLGGKREDWDREEDSACTTLQRLMRYIVIQRDDTEQDINISTTELPRTNKLSKPTSRTGSIPSIGAHTPMPKISLSTILKKIPTRKTVAAMIMSTPTTKLPQQVHFPNYDAGSEHEIVGQIETEATIRIFSLCTFRCGPKESKKSTPPVKLPAEEYGDIPEYLIERVPAVPEYTDSAFSLKRGLTQGYSKQPEVDDGIDDPPIVETISDEKRSSSCQVSEPLALQMDFRSVPELLSAALRQTDVFSLCVCVALFVAQW